MPLFLILILSIVGMAGASNTYASEDHLGFVLGYIGKLQYGTD